MKAKLLKYGIPVLLGIGCLFIPLLRNFHIESALAAAIIGCFWSGWAAAGRKDPTQSDISIILGLLGSIYLFGLVLLIHALIIGCFSFYGLGYWLLYPWPSVLFGYASGRVLRIWNVPFRRFVVIIFLLAVAIGVFLLKLFHYPEVYFFNQVWGGWPGPIYDETLKPGWNLVFFRIITVLWVGFFWWIPNLLRSRKAKIIVLICAALLAAGYTHLSELGITSPDVYLQKKLSGVKETPHFILYYGKNHYTKEEIGFIAQKEELYYNQITAKLNLTRPAGGNKIQCYLYGNVWQKKNLVGAKYTSYVPVWLKQDQLHIAKQQIPGSLKHELVHVLAKQFGNHLIHASWSIGLVEGLAVALSGGQSPVSTINEIVRSEKPYPTAKQMKQALSFWGFYKGRAAVSYIQSGSFVKYLLNNYPVKNFKQAYRSGDIEKSYHTSFNKLVDGWYEALDTTAVDKTDRNIATALYSVPSLFQQRCPHVQSFAARKLDRFHYYMALQDTSKALLYLDQLHKKLTQQHLQSSANSRWIYLHLKIGEIKKVHNDANLSSKSVENLLLYADAFAMSGDTAAARQYVHRSSRILQKTPHSILKLSLRTRQTQKTWLYYREIVYHQKAVTDSVFKTLDTHTQARALRQAINQQHGDRLRRYSRMILQEPLNVNYFDTYNRTIQWLAYLGNHTTANKFLQKVNALHLRKRYQQRLSETQEWIQFVERQSFQKIDHNK
jgi:hypothetical protein